MDDLLRQLMDRNEIQEILARYCRAIDRLDEPMLRSCFHGDSLHDHGYAGPSEAFCGFALEVLRGCVATHHQLGNISISVRGDVADAESYFTAYHRIGDEPPAAFGADTAGLDLTIGGRYVDRLERRDGVWRIVHRVGVHDWQRYEPAADRGFFDLAPDQRGRRDQTDPVYRRGA